MTASIYKAADFVTADPAVPALQPGDRLTRAEFERRYFAMPNLKKAELVEGVVFVPSPVSKSHGIPHSRIVTWIGNYVALSPGLETSDNATVRLDQSNEYQPDAYVRILPQYGGQSHDSDEFIGGPPELVAEIAASSVSYDLHAKLNAYRRNGVREYIVWRSLDREIDWFVWRDGAYELQALDDEGLYRSTQFPGLWLNVVAMLAGDMARVLQDLQRGLALPEHAQFLDRLQKARRD